MAYLYIEVNQIENASAILYNLLNENSEEEDFLIQSLYLSMKLNDVDEKLRSEVMTKICQLKPNNHLYKMWKLKWEIKHEMNQLTLQEITEKTLNFLKSKILKKESPSFFSYIFNNKYSIFLNMVSSLFLFTG
jgi:hypothetical protein